MDPKTKPTRMNDRSRKMPARTSNLSSMGAEGRRMICLKREVSVYDPGLSFPTVFCVTGAGVVAAFRPGSRRVPGTGRRPRIKRAGRASAVGRALRVMNEREACLSAAWILITDNRYLPRACDVRVILLR